ncbi:MAG TPA: hypothetical protein VN088_14780 [Nocardioides sp.]|nr:hypothetical protein [Nocardioides sp.]
MHEDISTVRVTNERLLAKLAEQDVADARIEGKIDVLTERLANVTGRLDGLDARVGVNEAAIRALQLSVVTKHALEAAVGVLLTAIIAVGTILAVWLHG